MTYNGWSNYETWVVGMYLDGNYTGEGTYHDVLELVEGSEGDRVQLADRLKDYVEQDLSIEAVQEQASIASDLLGAALSEVDWFELADSRLEDQS